MASRWERARSAWAHPTPAQIRWQDHIIGAVTGGAVVFAAVVGLYIALRWAGLPIV